MSTNVSLTPALEDYVKNKVAQGFYGSVSEFIREAIRLYRRHDIEYLQEMHASLDQAAEEIDRGEISPLNMQEIMAEVDAEPTTRRVTEKIKFGRRQQHALKLRISTIFLVINGMNTLPKDIWLAWKRLYSR